jgi:hypothetical protein
MQYIPTLFCLQTCEASLLPVFYICLHAYPLQGSLAISSAQSRKIVGYSKYQVCNQHPALHARLSPKHIPGLKPWARSPAATQISYMLPERFCISALMSHKRASCTCANLMNKI